MNACQKKNVSCFACCGVANLNLSEGQRQRILEERTREFHTLEMDFQRFPEYRAQREKKESSIQRHNPETYVCPFLGFIEPNRPGCMIHPARTGHPTSQNYSFYGASICLSYDCSAKDAEEKSGNTAYSDFLERVQPENYHRLICDSALFSLLETIPDFPDSVCRAPERNSALERLIELRLNHPDSERITSFERLMVRASDSQATMEELFLPENHREARQCLNSLKVLFTDRVDGSSLDR